MLNLIAAADPMEDVLPHPLFSLGHGVYFTNQMATALFVAIVMAVMFRLLFNRVRSEAPTGTRNFFESMLELLRIEVFRPALKEHTDRYLPFLWSLTFFILFCNLLGQIPFDQIHTLTTGKESWLNGTATANIAVTGALTIIALFVIHLSGVWQVAHDLQAGTYGKHAHHEEHSSNGSHGHEAAIDLEHMRAEALGADLPGDFKALGNPTAHYGDDEHYPAHLAPHAAANPGPHGPGMSFALAWLLALPLYLWNFAPHPFRPLPGQTAFRWLMDVPMWFFLLCMEFIGAVIKPLALMIRLFANMVSGHMVLAALVLLIPIGAGLAAQFSVGIPVTILSLMIRLLEVFVAFLQTYIFVFLTTLFLASAIAPEH